VSLSTAKSEFSPFTSRDSSVDPSPGPRTPKEEEIQPSEFSPRFEDNLLWNIRKTLNHLMHEKPTTSFCLYETLDEVFHHATIIDWSKEVKHTSEAIRISSTSTTIHCTMRGNAVEALHDPAIEACIISEYHVNTLVHNKPLTTTDKYLRSPLGLIFKCWGDLKGRADHHRQN
jgi:hypothetical protein